MHACSSKYILECAVCDEHSVQATDADIGDHALVYYNIITGQVPYLIDRDTGVVTTAGIFKGLSGTVHVVEVRAFDNLGNSPSLSTTSMMQVCVCSSCSWNAK